MRAVSDVFEERVARLVEMAKDWSEDQKDLAFKLAADYGTLVAEGLAGEEVEDEMSHVQAQIKNLAASAERTGMMIFNQALDEAISFARKLLSVV